MEIEKLIEQLQKSADFEDYPVVASFAAIIEKKYLREAAIALEQLRDESEKLKAQVPSWIPVEERLPEEEGLYIVCVDGEVKWDAYCMFEGVERWLCYDGRLNALYIDPYSSKLTREPPYPRVTHWMPLPPSPPAKGEK